MEIEKKSYVYLHIRPDKQEVFYIGLGSYNKKWKYERMLTIKNRNIHWKRIVALNNGIFETKLLFDNLTKSETALKEIELIAQYGRSDLKKGTLCNLTNGGKGIVGLSEESKKSISEKAKKEKYLLIQQNGNYI
jgi:hypothetical protein